MRYPDFYTPEQIKIGEQNWKNAWKYFKSIGAIPKDATPMRYNLHHKDPTLRYENPDRYILWLPEDLIPLTVSEHAKLHRKLEKENGVWEEANRKRSESWTNEKRQKQSEVMKVKMKGKMKDKHWFNDGTNQIRAFECPDGFVPGRLLSDEHIKHWDESRRCKERCRKASESLKGNQNAKGSHKSEEARQKIREARIRYWAKKRAEKAV